MNRVSRMVIRRRRPRIEPLGELVPGAALTRLVNQRQPRGKRLRELVPRHGFACLETGVVTAPWCCGRRMVDDGDCNCGCCDDYRCTKCGRRVRIEGPD